MPSIRKTWEKGKYFKTPRRGYYAKTQGKRQDADTTQRRKGDAETPRSFIMRRHETYCATLPCGRSFLL